MGRLELPTSRLWVVRSNQLSYIAKETRIVMMKTRFVKYYVSGSLKNVTISPKGSEIGVDMGVGVNDILAIISTKSKHKLMIQYFHNYVLIYRTVLPAHENALIVQKRFLPSAWFYINTNL